MSLLSLSSLFIFLIASPSAFAAWSEIPLTQMKITQGASEARILASGLAEINGSRFRAVVDGTSSRSALLAFTYRGEVADPEPIGSGDLRIQIGQKLLAADPCNLVYVMWRLFPTEALVVSVKRHPGTTSAECGNQGYTNVASVIIPIALSARRGATRRLQSQFNPRTHLLKVSIDGQAIWQDRLPNELLRGLKGPMGVRSDNGQFRFRLYNMN